VFITSYPAVFLPEDQGVHVRFPDIPEALTSGDDLPGTYVEAADCLAEALAGRMRRGESIPPPLNPALGQHTVNVPLSLAPKLALYLTMRDRELSNAALAQRLDVTQTVARQMLDPKHETKPALIEAALQSLGLRMVVSFEDAREILDPYATISNSYPAVTRTSSVSFAPKIP